MSKKIVYIRVVIGIICLLFISVFVFLIKGIQESIKTDDVVIEETTEEEKIVFNLNIAPREQKKKLRGHEKEYEDQLYHYIFNDEKMINTAKISQVSSYDAIIGFGNANDIINIYNKKPLKNLIKIAFSDEEIDYTQYAFTDNYIEKHPVSLQQEFNNILYKDNYEIKRYYSDAFESDIIISANYGYDIGIDRDNEMVIITETKRIDFETEDGESHGIRYGKRGSDWESEELFGNTRVIYFKYTLDEKDYLDDIKLDHIDVLIDDKLLDRMS